MIYTVAPRVTPLATTTCMLLSKCKRVNFYSFKELNAGQHNFEWLPLWNEWLQILWSQYQLFFEWIIHRLTSVWVKIFHSKMCCPAFNSLPLFSSRLHLESATANSDYWAYSTCQLPWMCQVAISSGQPGPLHHPHPHPSYATATNWESYDQLHGTIAEFKIGNI